MPVYVLHEKQLDVIKKTKVRMLNLNLFRYDTKMCDFIKIPSKFLQLKYEYRCISCK